MRLKYLRHMQHCRVRHRYSFLLVALASCADLSTGESETAGTTDAQTSTTTGSTTGATTDPTTGAPTTTSSTSTTSSTGSTGDSESSTTSSPTTGDPPAPVIPFACPGDVAIVPGLNTIQVGDKARTFLVDFPASPTRPLGVLFSWHGFGDSAENFRAALGLQPDGDPAAPVLIVTPEDSGLPPPIGLDWDIARGTEADANVDIAFFEAMLGCIHAQEDLDPTRIASLGFSAGSVMTSLLHSRYPELLGTIVNISGAWFNDPAQQDLVNIFTIDWNWPPLDPADGGVVLLTHGGPTDETVLGILNLEDAAQAALPFLAAAGRVVVDCGHGQGHTPHPDITPAVISAFLSAHRTGQPSPYFSGDLTGFPPSCTLRLP